MARGRAKKKSRRAVTRTESGKGREVLTAKLTLRQATGLAGRGMPVPPARVHDAHKNSHRHRRRAEARALRGAVARRDYDAI